MKCLFRFCVLVLGFSFLFSFFFFLGELAVCISSVFISCVWYVCFLFFVCLMCFVCLFVASLSACGSWVSPSVSSQEVDIPSPPVDNRLRFSLPLSGVVPSLCRLMFFFVLQSVLCVSA